MTESFILGLSSGSACLFTCGMAMFPYLMSGSSGVRKISLDISFFLGTRLIVYLLLATLAWYFGKAVFTNRIAGNIIPGILYIVFAVMLVWYSIGKNREKHCTVRKINRTDRNKMVPVMLGIVNSIGFCPALYLILTKGAAQGTLMNSYLDFLAFFAGSSIWFIPLPVAGKIRKKEVLETIGIFATGLAGIIFLIKGLTNLIGGLIYG
jgi:hypothetical protein